MSEDLISGQYSGPTQTSLITLRLAEGPATLKLLGTPGPTGPKGEKGEQGSQGDPGITLLPTDTPINGGFF